MRMKPFAAAVLVPSFILWAEVLPPDRRIDWAPGVPDGIPADKDSTVNVMSFGAAADGTADAFPAFDAAIKALPDDGGIVVIPEGSFHVDSKLSLGSGVVLRGAGSTKTRLLFHITGTDPCIEIITYRRGTWTAVTDGMTKGSRELTVADGTSFTPGAFVEIQQDNDSALMYTAPEWNQSWAAGAVGQINEVESVNGNTVTLRKPLYLTYNPALNPQIRTQGFVTHAGVENLYIKRMVSTADGSTIALKNAAFCWIRGVESDYTRKSHVTCNTVYACEFRDSYFHHAYDYGGSGHGYGVELGLHATDCLTENNIFRHLRHSMMVHVGASGDGIRLFRDRE